MIQCTCHRFLHNLVRKRIVWREVSHSQTVLLILSKNSVVSDWVEWEAKEARKFKKETGRDILCPIALEDSWKTCDWLGALRGQIENYYVMDFA